MKIGELSNATGVSVRSLHHYDEIGLLKPTERSDSGHRLYSKDDIRRLQRIVTLRGVGLSLEQVGAVLGKGPSAVMDIVDRRIETLENEITEKTKTLQTLRTAQKLLELKPEINVERIIAAIKDVGLLEGRLSQEEIIGLAERDAALREQGAPDFETQAKDLVKRFQFEMQKGSAPASAIAQALILEWQELAKQIIAGNEGMEQKIKEAYKANSKTFDEMAAGIGLTNEVLSYMKEVGEAQMQGKTAH